nr:glycosyltransferase family 4 protein [Rhizobium sp. L1K21]
MKTGGYGYDRRLIHGLKALGWGVELRALGDGFPSPGEKEKRRAEEVLSALEDGTLLLIDGLAFGVLDAWASKEGERLKIVGLVHHPLALETGLSAQEQSRFKESETRALSHAKHLIVTSPGTARELAAHYGVQAEHITVAVPGTEPAAISTCSGDPPQILSIGTLIPRKGHDILIEALHRVSDLAWSVTIVGSKTLHPQTANDLSEQIARLGLRERVMLAGEQNDTRALLAKADIFALASRYEGYGMVFAEALSQGVPIVACHAGAIPDVVPEDAGFLVPVDDAEAFADALRALLSDRALLKSRAAAARRAGAMLPDWSVTAHLVSDALEAQL